MLMLDSMFQEQVKPHKLHVQLEPITNTGQSSCDDAQAGYYSPGTTTL